MGYMLGEGMVEEGKVGKVGVGLEISVKCGRNRV